MMKERFPSTLEPRPRKKKKPVISDTTLFGKSPLLSSFFRTFMNTPEMRTWINEITKDLK